LAAAPAVLTETRVVCPAKALTLPAAATIEKMRAMPGTKTLLIPRILFPPHHTTQRAVDDF
jgi:hypothetical protein